VFNCQTWIAAAIQSALDQTWTDKEVIVVDDGSTDRTPEICRAFGDRIQYVRQENGGQCAANNHILRIAKGEWVQFLDADDYLKPEKIEAQLLSRELPPEVEVIYSPVVFETWKGGQRLAEEVQPITGDSDLLALWLGWMMPQTGGCLWKKEALVRIGSWNEGYKRNTDYELYSRAIKSKLNFHFVDAPLAVYRIWSEDTACRRDKRTSIMGITDLIHEFIAWLRSEGRLTPALEKVAGRRIFAMARTLATQDLTVAASYYQQQKAAGLIDPIGPAAPWKYRLALTLLGFRRAECFASWMRAGPAQRS